MIAVDNPRGLIGRQAELELLGRLADPSNTGELILLSGDAGIGKTALLSAVIDRAKGAGITVLSAAAARSEREIAFAGLHALLGTRLAAVNALPVRHRDPLLALLGVAGSAAPTDRLVLGMATLALLGALSDDSPLLVVLDDVQWLDENSLAALTFAGRRLAGANISMILCGRDDLVPEGLDRAVTELRLDPLSHDDAARLLDQQMSSPSWPAREQVLLQSAGNPAALIELGAAVTNAEPASRYALDLLPLPRRLAAVYAGPLSGLPESTLTALLTASAASPADFACALGYLPNFDVNLLSAAELVGLVSVGPGGITFMHPLLRSAVYYRAPFTARASAHRELAAALSDQPDRQAWHLSKATLRPDEEVASLLEATYQQARQRGGFIAAAAAMKRAAALSPNRADRARRLATAASLARFTGDMRWSEDLASQALALPADSRQESRARIELAWALCWTTHHEAALDAALRLVDTDTSDTKVAWEALRMAATVAFHTGSDTARQAVATALDTLDHGLEDGLEDGSAAMHLSQSDHQSRESTRMLAQLVVTPGNTGSQITAIDEIARQARDPLDVGALGVGAWLADETDLSLRLLRRAAQDLQAQGAGRQSAAVLMALASTCMSTGRWDEALSATAELSRVAQTRGQPFVHALANVARATVLGWRGDFADARECLVTALNSFDPKDSRAVGGWALRASGVICLAEDSDMAAFTQLRRLFDGDGKPFHYHVSYLALADFAEAAVRTGRQTEAREVIAGATASLGDRLSPRISQLLAHAQALLTEPSRADEWFGSALADPAGERFLFERARLRLSYGQWLRRRRHVTEAKRELAEALTVFQALRATPWITRAAREIRAAGIRVADQASGLNQLSPQEQQVVYFAGQGLSNRQIGQLLNLSPRTVGAHLYRAFPKLGVTNRRQIRDIPAPQELIDTSVPQSDVAEQANAAPR